MWRQVVETAVVGPRRAGLRLAELLGALMATPRFVVFVWAAIDTETVSGKDVFRFLCILFFFV